MAGSAYIVAKEIHVACAALSVAGFGVRGALRLAGSPGGEARFARIAPHVVDTLLLASALWVAWLSGQYPFVQGWLTAKVLALVAYIGLGSVALARGTRSRQVRAYAFVAALATVGYIVSVALTRDPRGALVWLLPG